MSNRFPRAFFPIIALLLGCSSDEGGHGLGLGGAASSAGMESRASGGARAGIGASSGGAKAGTGIVVISGGGTGRTAPGNGTAEICDGIDNDANGIVDDLDLGNDGVCDCLSIATLGTIGPWSTGGNIFEEWLDRRSPQGAVALGDQLLTPELLAPFQVIVSLHVATTAASRNERTAPPIHAYADSEVAAFQDWIANGGGAMTTIGYLGDETSEVVNINRLLSSVGMGYSTSRLDLSYFVTSWVAHPVTDGVRNIFTDNGVEPDGPAGMTVARGRNDAVALQVTQAGNGRVVVWGDEWITYDSEWEDLRDQQVELFWLNILKWLSPPTACQVPIPPTIPR